MCHVNEFILFLKTCSLRFSFFFQQKEKPWFICPTKHALYSSLTIKMVRWCVYNSVYYFTLMMTPCFCILMYLELSWPIIMAKIIELIQLCYYM